MEPSAYFSQSGDGTFHPTDFSRGPWSVDSCHAGPPTGLMARASEHLAPDKPLIRLMVEITRPIPMSGFRIGAVVARTGRTVTTTRIELHDDQRSYARAEGLHLSEGEIGPIASHHTDVVDLADTVPGPFPIAPRHDEVAFGHSLDVRYVPGMSQGDGGETFMWARAKVPLLDGEEPSPFQTICPLADSGNGISWHEGTETMAFVNADLIVSLHRPPAGEWLGSHTVSFWEPNGIGRADAELFDETGPVGRAMQNLVLRRHH